MLKPRQRIWSASLRRLVDLLASRMSFGMASIRVKMVAPVVVKPDKASK